MENIKNAQTNRMDTWQFVSGGGDSHMIGERRGETEESMNIKRMHDGGRLSDHLCNWVGFGVGYIAITKNSSLVQSWLIVIFIFF